MRTNLCGHCGRVIESLPFWCRHCGGEHCFECRLPESHSCRGLIGPNYCHHCKEKIKSLPLRCHRCNETFCVAHSLPENHYCPSYVRDEVSVERPSQQRITEIKEETDDGFPLAKTICLGILLALLLLILFPSQPSMPPQMIVQTPALTPAMPLAPPSYTFTPETTSPPTTTPAPNFETGLMFTSTGKRSLGYTLRGVTTYVKIETYSGLKNYLTGLPRTYQCSITSLGSQPVCPSERELELRYLDQSAQKRYLEELSEKLKLQAGTKNDQARVAISLVQKIHYDEEGVRTNQLNNRYPYEVVYDNAGVCGEKSRLLAFLLRDIGFNVVLFSYEPENHMAVGIKCPMRYSYKNTGYCFIETAKPTIITNDQETYVGVGNLYSTPEIIPISDGISFDDVSEEYNDAREWIRINKLGDSSGGRLDRSTYNKWTSLVNKYGIEVSGEGR